MISRMSKGSTYALVFSPNTKEIREFSKDFSDFFGETLNTSEILTLEIRKIDQKKGKMAVYSQKTGEWTKELNITDDVRGLMNWFIEEYNPSEVVDVTKHTGDVLRAKKISPTSVWDLKFRRML